MSKITMADGHKARLSYTNLIEPRAQDSDHPDVKTYSTAILISKSDKVLVDAIKAAIAEALAEGRAKFGWKGSAGLKNPLRDGDTKEDKNGKLDEVYSGSFFLNAKGPRGGAEAPVLMDKNADKTESASVIYPGVEARLSLQFYPFEKSGNKGVACSVSAVLSLETGEPLGNTVTVESARNEFGVTSTSTTGAAAAEFKNSEAKPAAAAAVEADPWAE